MLLKQMGLVAIASLVVYFVIFYKSDETSLKEVGEPCRNGFECVTQTCCQSDVDIEPLCQMEETCKALGIGDTCIKDETPCQPGLTCCTGMDDALWLCRPGNRCSQSTEGASCVLPEDCSAGLKCCGGSEDRERLMCRKPSACLKENGAVCVQDKECRDFFCCSGQCAAPSQCSDAHPQPDGHQCNTSRDCTSRVCCSGVCKASLDECPSELTAEGMPCNANLECVTNLCCESSPSLTTCQHPDGCLKKEGEYCSSSLQCRSSVCCQKGADRRKCQEDTINCKREENQPCDIGTPCVPELKCCKGNSLYPMDDFTCRPLEKCILNLGDPCTSDVECVPGETVCCTRKNDPQRRCHPVNACSKITCPVETSMLRSCLPSNDSCGACSDTRVCRTIQQNFTYQDKEGQLIQAPPGDWCLPEPPSFQCQASVADTVFVTDLEKWGCHCKFPKLIHQTSLGGPCAKVLACKPNGTLVHKTTKYPWTTESDWDPDVHGMCLCAPSYTYVEDDGYKKCV